MSAQTYIKGKTDIPKILDNLRAGIQGKPFGDRACGRSYTITLLMAGHVLHNPQPNTTYVYFGVNEIACDMVMRDLFEILQHKGYSIDRVVQSRKMLHVKQTGQTFFFISHHDWHRTARGWNVTKAYTDLAYAFVRREDLDMMRMTIRDIYDG